MAYGLGDLGNLLIHVGPVPCLDALFRGIYDAMGNASSRRAEDRRGLREAFDAVLVLVFH